MKAWGAPEFYLHSGALESGAASEYPVASEGGRNDEDRSTGVSGDDGGRVGAGRDPRRDAVGCAAGRGWRRPEEGGLRVDAPEGAGLPRQVQAGPRRGVPGHRDRDDFGPGRRRRDQGGVGEDRPQDPRRHERGPLALPAVERRPGGRQQERRGHGDVAAQREALGRRRGPARAGRRQPRDRLQGRLDAFAEGDQGADPAAGAGTEGRRRHGGGLEQVPPQPARDGALLRRVQLALGEGVLRRRQHAVLRVPAGLDPDAGAAHRPRPRQGLQARSQGEQVLLDEPRRRRRGLAGGEEGARRGQVRRVGDDRDQRRRRRLPEGRRRAPRRFFAGQKPFTPPA